MGRHGIELAWARPWRGCGGGLGARTAGREPGRSRCGHSIEHGTDVSRESADARALVSNELNPTGDCAATTSKVKDGSVTFNASKAGLDD